MVTLTEIIAFVRDELAVKYVGDQDDICYDLGCTGDDFVEFMDRYAARFNVDMTGYLWYFHAEDEANVSLVRFYRNAPFEQVEHIAVTSALLLVFARSQKWQIDYPDHTIKPQRFNHPMILIWVLIIVALLVANQGI